MFHLINGASVSLSALLHGSAVMREGLETWWFLHAFTIAETHWQYCRVITWQTNVQTLPIVAKDCLPPHFTALMDIHIAVFESVLLRFCLNGNTVFISLWNNTGLCVFVYEHGVHMVLKNATDFWVDDWVDEKYVLLNFILKILNTQQAKTIG